MSHPNHIGEFAAQMIRAKGPLTAAVLWAAFRNAGNDAPTLVDFSARLEDAGMLMRDPATDTWRLADDAA